MTRLLYRVTYKRCRVDTINSPDDGHMAARNMYGIEINIHEKELCVKLVIYKECKTLLLYSININKISGEFTFVIRITTQDILNTAK